MSSRIDGTATLAEPRAEPRREVAPEPRPPLRDEVDLMCLHDVVAVMVNGQSVSLREMLRSMQVDIGFDVLLSHVIEQALVNQWARSEGITVTTAELQSESDRLRGSMGLYKASDTRVWLRDNHLTPQDLERRLEHSVLKRKLRNRLSHGQTERYFAENRAYFDSARISCIALPTAAAADELLRRLRERTIAFDTRNAAPHGRSVLPTHGIVYRRDLPATMAAAIFSSREQAIIGPLQSESGHHIVRIEKLHPGTLDEEVNELIKDILYRNWLANQERNANVEFKLPQLLSAS